MKSRIIQGCVDLVRTGLNEISMRVIAAFGAEIATGKVVGTGSSGSTIVSALHGLSVGQRIVFTSGVYRYQEFSTIGVPSVNSIQVNYDFGSVPPSALDKFDVLQPTTPRVSSDGKTQVSDVNVAVAVESLSLELSTGNILINPFSASGTSLTLFTSASTGLHKFDIKQNGGLNLVINKNAVKIGNILPGGEQTFIKSLVPGDALNLSVVSSATGVGSILWNVHT